MNESSKIINFSICIVFLAVIVFGTFYLPRFSIRDTITEVKKTKSEFLTYKDLLNEKKETEAEFGEVAASYKEKKENFGKIGLLILPEPNLVLLLIQFENLASQNGMIMKNISFGTLEASPQKNIGVFPVNITVEGNYNAFKNYLDSISRNLPLLDVEKITFSLPSAEALTDTLSFSLTVNTYTEKTPASQQTNQESTQEVSPSPITPIR